MLITLILKHFKGFIAKIALCHLRLCKSGINRPAKVENAFKIQNILKLKMY